MNTFPQHGKLSDHLCLQEALERFGTPELLYEMLEIFRAESPPMLEHLGRAFQGGDLNKIAAQAHRLKGSLSMLGANGAAHLAERLRHSALRGDHASVSQRYQELTRAVDELVALLDSKELRPPIL